MRITSFKFALRQAGLFAAGPGAHRGVAAAVRIDGGTPPEPLSRSAKDPRSASEAAGRDGDGRRPRTRGLGRLDRAQDPAHPRPGHPQHGAHDCGRRRRYPGAVRDRQSTGAQAVSRCAAGADSHPHRAHAVSLHPPAGWKRCARHRRCSAVSIPHLRHQHTHLRCAGRAARVRTRLRRVLRRDSGSHQALARDGQPFHEPRQRSRRSQAQAAAVEPCEKDIRRPYAAGLHPHHHRRRPERLTDVAWARAADHAPRPQGRGRAVRERRRSVRQAPRHLRGRQAAARLSPHVAGSLGHCEARWHRAAGALRTAALEGVRQRDERAPQASDHHVVWVDLAL